MAESRVHVVERGEHISAIAARYGISDWRTIWNASADLQAARKDPHQLLPGDVLTIPLERTQSAGIENEKEHSIEIEREALCLRLAILDDKLQPIAGASYSLELGGQVLEGKTDGKGGVLVENLPPDATCATLTVLVKGEAKGGEVASDIPCTWSLEIGGLHPILEDAPDAECLAGVQQRLANLGFYDGDVTGQANDATRSAISAFRARLGLSSSNRSDAELQRALKSAHDTAEPIPAKKGK